MAEPTCVMNPFSYTTPASFPDDIHEENRTMHGIEESVSFGRFTSDNLEWEKWSSFNSNRNRYVEEAEKYSKPGSVAQKKAYFEAHFKRIAALKAAAASQEQANASENSSEGKTGGKGIDSTTQDADNLSISVQIEGSSNQEAQKDQKESENEDNSSKGFVVHRNDLYSDGTKNDLNANPCEKSVALKDETCNGSKQNQSCGVVQRDKPPLQKRSSYIEEASESIVKKNPRPPLSSYMSPTVREYGTKYEGSVHPGKENYTTPIKNKTSVTDQDKKKTPLRLSINREINRIISPVLRKIGSSSKSSTPLKSAAKTVNAGLESPRVTPSRGTRSRLVSFVGDNKAPGSRWHIFSSDSSMSPSTGKHRISSPIIPNSFCMNGERGARRKQKLEEKFNATATERPPQSSKFKEKAEAELNKFRQSFCFKAMSSPEQYGENEALTSPNKKDGCTQGKSPKRGKSTSKISLPPRRPFVKQSISKIVQHNSDSSANKTSG